MTRKLLFGASVVDPLTERIVDVDQLVDARAPAITRVITGLTAGRSVDLRRARILDADFRAYLQKPFTPDKLVKTILSVLND